MFRVVYRVFLLFSRQKVGKRRWKRLRRASRPFHALKDNGFNDRLIGRFFKGAKSRGVVKDRLGGKF